MSTNGWGIQIFQDMLAQREGRRQQLRSELESLESEIKSIQQTQSLYMKEHDIPELPETPLLNYKLSLTKRREKALIEWTERNNNILRPKEAKHALVAAGLIKPGKGAGWIVYGTIANMDCWEKLDPGVYKLLKAEDGSPLSFRQMNKVAH